MKLNYLFGSALISAFLMTGPAHAQLVSCDVFLQGNHVEVGVSPTGSYGSSNVAPSGYHGDVPGGSSYHPCGATATGSHLGFVADPELTGWDTSASSHYWGDYFLPGSPFEGWSIQLGGIDTQYQAYNTISAGFHGPLTGSNTSYLSSVEGVTGTWQGMADSIGITQVTTVDTGALYFTTKVTFTNYAVAPMNNIYYMRSVDPDNDQTWPGGNFTTNNVITYQVPDSMNASVVSAAGLSSALSIMYLGTTDTNAVSFIYNAWPLTASVDLSTVYNKTYGTAYYDVGVNHPGDIGIGLVIKVPHLASVDSAGDSVARVTSTSTLHPANTASFSFFYAFGHKGLDSALHSFSHTTNPGTLGINPLNQEVPVNVFPNPAKDAISITGLNITDHLAMYDLMGRRVNINWSVTSAGTNSYQLSNLPSGTYLLAVTDMGGNIRSRTPICKM